MLFVAVVLMVSPVALAHIWRMGKCPVIEPMVDFDKYQVLGTWYVQRSLSEEADCTTVQYTRLATEGDRIQVEERPEDGRVSTGTITPAGDPGMYTIVYQVNRVTARYAFIYTDYENIAFVAHCQQFVFFHRINVYVMSRDTKLDVSSFNDNAWRLSKQDLMLNRLTQSWTRQCAAFEPEEPAVMQGRH